MNQSTIRANRIRSRAQRVRRRVRFARKRIERISRTATLGGLFLSFLKIGLVGFGGGVAVLAQIRTLTVRKRSWLTDSDFAEAVALAQSLPGTSAGNSVTYIGLLVRGWRGAVVAMSGFILPSMVMMIGLAIVYKHLRAFSDTQRFFHGLNGAVVALILVTAWRMGKNILTKRWQWMLAVLAFLAVAILDATVFEVVFAAGLIGIYIDSFAEKQWRRWRSLHTIVTRRRAAHVPVWQDKDELADRTFSVAMYRGILMNRSKARTVRKHPVNDLRLSLLKRGKNQPSFTRSARLLWLCPCW